MAAVIGIVASLVGPIVEIGKLVAAPIKRQLSYLCCFSSHIKNLEDEAGKLQDARDGLQTKREAAESRGEVIVQEVDNWLTSVDRQIAIERGIPKVQTGCSTIITRYSLSKKAKETVDAMKDLQDRCNKIDPISQPAPPAADDPYPLEPTHDFESREKIEQEIMDALKGKTFNIIGISGMGGVGKTTLAKRIMNKVREAHLFDKVVMAVVSQPLDLPMIQTQISEQLGLGLKDETLFARAHQLRGQLKGAKKILIVLDDIWETFQLGEIGIPCERGVEGCCTVLLTSRDEDVLTRMGAQMYTIQTLSRKEAWLLFCDKSGCSADDHDLGLDAIRQQVAEECKGLPLALEIVGSALKDKKVKRFWESALQQLKCSNPEDIPDVIRKVYIPLRLSYDSLESQHAKSLFLLCCLFPEDYSIRVEHLALYCMGLPIFEGMMNLEEIRNRVFVVVETLKSRYLLLNDDNRTCGFVKMHDVVRDVAIFIASKEGLVHSRGHNSDIECKWVSFFSRDDVSMLLNNQNFPNLQLLVMMDTSLNIEDTSFLGRMTKLNVLSFCGVSLPQTMSPLILKNLRALHLEICNIRTISIVGELFSLEIICCRSCDYIEELPIEIGKLSHLKLLEFSDCYKFKKVPQGILPNLKELEELTMVGSFSGWELAEPNGGNVNASLHDLDSLVNLMRLNIEIADYTLASEEITNMFPKIEKYSIKFGEPLEDDTIYGPDYFEKKIHLNMKGDITLGSWIQNLARRTQELRLGGNGSNNLVFLNATNVNSLFISYCSTVKKLEDITRFGDFNVLEFMHLAHLSNLKEICDVSIAQEDSNTFKNLEVLFLDDLPMLEHLWNNENGKKSHITFPQLKGLKLSSLKSLKSFCHRIESIEVPMLEIIRIQECPELTSLISSSVENNQNSGSTTHLFCIEEASMSFKNLESISIQRLSALKHLWNNSNQNVSLTNLERISIKECIDLRNLFPLKMVIANGGFSNLTTLSIRDCGMMDDVFPIKEEENYGEISFPALILMEIIRCPKFKILGSSLVGNRHHHDDDLDSTIHLFCSATYDSLEILTIDGYNDVCNLWCHQIPDSFFVGLESLHIGGCDNIRSLFPYAVVRNLVKLERLKIKGCKEMVKVIEDEEEITTIIENNGPLALFPKLEELRLNSLPKLECFCAWRRDIELPELFFLRIGECPMMKVFTMASFISTPKLYSPSINGKDYNLKDLNEVIRISSLETEMAE